MNLHQGNTGVPAGPVTALTAVVEAGMRDYVLALEAERDRLREALLIAADDLDKAANQFAGLAYAPHLATGGSNERRFAEKAKRAREAAA